MQNYIGGFIFCGLVWHLHTYKHYHNACFPKPQAEFQDINNPNSHPLHAAGEHHTIIWTLSYFTTQQLKERRAPDMNMPHALRKRKASTLDVDNTIPYSEKFSREKTFADR